jgi:hypothetical protein
VTRTRSLYFMLLLLAALASGIVFAQTVVIGQGDAAASAQGEGASYVEACQAAKDNVARAIRNSGGVVKSFKDCKCATDGRPFSTQPWQCTVDAYFTRKPEKDKK